MYYMYIYICTESRVTFPRCIDTMSVLFPLGFVDDVFTKLLNRCPPFDAIYRTSWGLLLVFASEMLQVKQRLTLNRQDDPEPWLHVSFG